MAGHNKWTQIKHQKGAADAKKAKVFAMFGRIIAIESKKAAGNTSAPGLKTAIERARKANMPNDNIDRAVKRGVGGDAGALEEILIEGYGPGGVALLIEAVTDSRNRTVSEVKHLLSKHGGSPATPGAAVWAFQKTAEGYSPTSTVELTEQDLEVLTTLVDALEEHDDVKAVTANAA